MIAPSSWQEMGRQITYIHTSGHWQRKWIKASSSSADLHPWQNSLNESLVISACFPITQWPESSAIVIEMTLRLRPSNWLVRLLAVGDQVSLAMKQDSSLTQHRFASRKNFSSIDNLTGANGVHSSIEEKERFSPSEVVGSTVSPYVTVP